MAKKYEVCYVDFDTCLFTAAKATQKDFIIVTHKVTKEVLRFSGVKEFRGLGKKQDGGYIGDTNKSNIENGLPLISASDYEVEPCSEIIDSPDPTISIIDYAITRIDFKVGEIKKVCDADEYVLGIGGNSNFRYDVAHIIPYKGLRTAKPILFQEVRDAFISKYKNKVMIARDGLEQDDEVSIKGWESYEHFCKTGKHKYVLGYIDKDLKQVPCPNFNYDKCEEGITEPTINECALAFTSQLLSGDKGTDNILGLPNFSLEFGKKYNIRRSTGIGKATALQILEGCNNPKEMYERVVEAYKSYYGEDEKEFTSFRGEVFTWDWLDYLKENALLLYMMRKMDERYDISVTLKRLEII